MFGEEGEWGGFGDCDVCELSGERFGGVEYDDVVGCGSGDELGVVVVFGGVEVGFFAGAFDEYFKGLSDKSFVVLCGDGVLDFKKSHVTLLLCLQRDGVDEVDVCAGSGAGRVFEDEDVFVTGLLDEVGRCGEIFIGFAGKAHDEVARDCDIADDMSCAVEEVEILFCGVAAIHGFEDCVGAGLGGDVEVGADFGDIGHCAEGGIVEGDGVAGDETNPVDAVDLGGHFEEVCECICPVACGICV